MLELNHQPRCADHLNAAIDAALVAQHAATPPRPYLGGSRLGHPCERALQGGFRWSSQHRGGGWLRWLVGGVRTELCGRSLLRLAARG